MEYISASTEAEDTVSMMAKLGNHLPSYVSMDTLRYIMKTGPRKQDEPDFNNGIIVPLLTFFSVGMLFIFIFCVVRNIFKDIYSSRRYLVGGRPPKLRENFLLWIPQLIMMPESVLISTVGIDGVMLLRFFSMGIKLFAVLTVFGLGILGPVNYYAKPPSFTNSTGILHEDVMLPALTITNIDGWSSALYYHFFFTWFLSIVVYFTLMKYFGMMSKMKSEYDAYILKRTKMSKIDQRSVMVFGIPPELRHEVDLAGYFESLGLGKVENVVICRQWSKLQKSVEKRANYLNQLESVYSRILYNLSKDKDLTEVEALLKDAGSFSTSHTPSAQALVLTNFSSLRNEYPQNQDTHNTENPFSDGEDSPEIVNPWQDVTDPGLSINNLPEETHDISNSDLIGNIQRRGPRPQRRNFLHDVENQPLLESNLPKPLNVDFENPSVKEILSRLEAISENKRPQHRIGLLGIIGKKVDSAYYYAAKFSKYDKLVQKLRKFPENSPATSVGFVTFESPESAVIAEQVTISTKPYACICRRAPEPRDLYWRNLSSPVADSNIKIFRKLFVIGVHLLLVFSSTAVIAAINFLATIERLENAMPGLKHFFASLSPNWRQFIKGVIPVVSVSVWTGSLPTLLIFLTKVQGLEAESWIDESVLSKYFFYQIYNILLVQTIAPSITEVLNMIEGGPHDILRKIGRIMPGASPYQINYVMLQATVVYPIQLLLIGPLLLTWIFRILSWGKATARQTSQAYYPSVMFSISYGLVYPIPILVFCIGIVYAPVAPLILPFCLLFYIMAWFVYRYILLYVNIPRYESIGMQTPLVIRRCLVGVLIMQTSMMGILVFKAGSASTSNGFQMLVGLLPLVFMTIALFYWFKLGYEKVVRHTSMEILGEVATQLRLEMQLAEKNGSQTPNTAVSPSIFDENFVVRESRQGMHSANSLYGGYEDESAVAKELASVGKFNREHPNEDLSTSTNLLSSLDSSPTATLSRKSLTRSITNVGSLRNKTRSQPPSASTSFQAGIHPSAGEILTPTSTVMINEHHAHPGDGPDGVCPLETNPWDSNSGPSGGKGKQLVGAGTDSSSTMAARDGATSSGPKITIETDVHRQERLSPTAIEVIENDISSEGGMPNGYHGSDEASEGNESAVSQEALLTNNIIVDMIDSNRGNSNGSGSGKNDKSLESHIQFHVEPPMTRVTGILDAPFGAATAVVPAAEEQDPMFFVGAEQDDLTLHTYLHPALVGRLPIAWLPDTVQPKLLTETRLNQRGVQRDLYRRVVSLLRVGVRMNREEQIRELRSQVNDQTGDVQGDSDDSEDAIDDEFFGEILQWRGNRWEQRSEKRHFIREAGDSVSGWLQLLLT